MDLTAVRVLQAEALIGIGKAENIKTSKEAS